MKPAHLSTGEHETGAPTDRRVWTTKLLIPECFPKHNEFSCPGGLLFQRINNFFTARTRDYLSSYPAQFSFRIDGRSGHDGGDTGKVERFLYPENVAICRRSLMMNVSKPSVRFVSSWKLFGVVISWLMQTLPWLQALLWLLSCWFVRREGIYTANLKWIPSRNAKISSYFPFLGKRKTFLP